MWFASASAFCISPAHGHHGVIYVMSSYLTARQSMSDAPIVCQGCLSTQITLHLVRPSQSHFGVSFCVLMRDVESSCLKSHIIAKPAIQSVIGLNC